MEPAPFAPFTGRMMATMHPRLLARATGVMVTRKGDVVAGLNILVDRLGVISPVAPKFAMAADLIGGLSDELARADIDSSDFLPLMNRINQYVSKLKADLLEFDQLLAMVVTGNLLL